MVTAAAAVAVSVADFAVVAAATGKKKWHFENFEDDAGKKRNIAKTVEMVRKRSENHKFKIFLR